VGRLRKGGGGRTIELVVAIALLLAVVLYIGVVTLALVRRGVSGAFLALTGTAILGLWLTFLVLSAADYKDADGWIDCNNSCSNLQTATGSILFYGLAALALLLVVFGIATLARPPTRSR
jgi:hypothetical protein